MKLLRICVPFLFLLTAAGTHASTVLYNNGPFISDLGAGFGGADASVLRDSMTSYGSNFNTSLDYSVADDFVVPTGEIWDLTGVQFYGYQTNSTLTSTFTSLKVQIWNGRPGDLGASVIWGNWSDNLLETGTFSGVYRVLSGALTATDRPIMSLNGAVIPTLTAGSYWIQWGTTGSLVSGPWAPPITIPGQSTTGNARQYSNGSWVDANLSPGFQQDFPFQILGDVSAVPEPGSVLGTLLLIGSAFGVRVRQRRRS